MVVCPNLAASPLGLCSWHGTACQRDGSPGGAALPGPSWWHQYEQLGQPVPVSYTDETAFRAWCAATAAQPWPGQVNLRGLRPLVRAEIQWGLFAHTRRGRPTRWDLAWIRALITTCRALEVDSLAGFEIGAGASAEFTGAIAKEIRHELRLVYFTPEQAKDAGFLETEHFGVLFPHRMSHIDLTAIPQRWLRNLAGDHIAALLQSPPARAPPASPATSAAPPPSWASSWNSTLRAAVTTRRCCTVSTCGGSSPISGTASARRCPLRRSPSRAASPAW